MKLRDNETTRQVVETIRGIANDTSKGYLKGFGLACILKEKAGAKIITVGWRFWNDLCGEKWDDDPKYWPDGRKIRSMLNNIIYANHPKKVHRAAVDFLAAIEE